MQKVQPFLWYDKDAEEAANFYVSLLPDSKVTKVTVFEKADPWGNDVKIVEFTLGGTEFVAMDAGPQFKFTEAISFTINCDDQAEVDRLWDALTKNGGQESQCGWLKDKWGLSWQITPKQMNDYTNGPDKEGAHRAMQAMLTMKKIDLGEIKKAYEGA